MSYGRALLLLPALAAAPGIHAEVLYVIGQLVVNVNSAPDGSGERVASIKSGDAVEVLDRQGEQVHVHLASGTEGWVRKSYLSSEEPLQHQLSERTAEVEKLKEDIKRLQTELATALAAAHGHAGSSAQTNISAGAPLSAAAPAATTPGPNPTSRSAPRTSASGPPRTDHGAETDADPSASEPSYFMTPPEAPARPAWHWALGSFVIALALGFALGWQVLDRRIRRKYGGLRIY